MRVSHVVSASFRVYRRSDCGWSVLSLYRGWCAAMAFLQTQERTKERSVLFLRRYFRQRAHSAGSAPLKVHSANESVTVSCVMLLKAESVASLRSSRSLCSTICRGVTSTRILYSSQSTVTYVKMYLKYVTLFCNGCN